MRGFFERREGHRGPPRRGVGQSPTVLIFRLRKKRHSAAQAREESEEQEGEQEARGPKANDEAKDKPGTRGPGKGPQARARNQANPAARDDNQRTNDTRKTRASKHESTSKTKDQTHNPGGPHPGDSFSHGQARGGRWPGAGSTPILTGAWPSPAGPERSFFFARFILSEKKKIA